MTLQIGDTAADFEQRMAPDGMPGGKLMQVLDSRSTLAGRTSIARIDLPPTASTGVTTRNR